MYSSTIYAPSTLVSTNRGHVSHKFPYISCVLFARSVRVCFPSLIFARTQTQPHKMVPTCWVPLTKMRKNVRKIHRKALDGGGDQKRRANSFRHRYGREPIRVYYDRVVAGTLALQLRNSCFRKRMEEKKNVIGYSNNNNRRTFEKIKIKIHISLFGVRLVAARRWFDYISSLLYGKLTKNVLVRAFDICMRPLYAFHARFYSLYSGADNCTKSIDFASELIFAYILARSLDGFWHTSNHLELYVEQQWWPEISSLRVTPRSGSIFQIRSLKNVSPLSSFLGKSHFECSF